MRNQSAPSNDLLAGVQRGEGSAVAEAAQALVAVARIDTLYADLYLQRARSILASELSEEGYRAALRGRSEETALSARLQEAIEVEAWDDVRALSARLATLRRTAREREALVAAAQAVYEFADELVDPFSPGLTAIARLSAADLPALREDAVRRLEGLRRLDPEWGELYRARQGALAALRFASRGADREPPRRSQALHALRSLDFERLERLASRFVATADTADAGPGATSFRSDVADLTFEFSPETRARAARLGLEAVRVESARHLVHGLAPYLWHPADDEEDGAGHGTVRIPMHVATDEPEVSRERLQLYLDRPFLNSGGARDLPSLAEEDLLVEAFDEPAPDAAPANTALLEALGLPRRNGLGRTSIERALLLRGHDVVRELCLEPRDFRLVCIPPDLHVRIGRTRGWGTQPMWTHLDGRMVLPKRRFLALAGGDVRFGGIYDLVGIGRDYDPTGIGARFAVVQRRRMAAW